MHQYEWDPETGGILLKPQQSKSSNEPRPVYYREMNMLGMDRRWIYPQNDDAPIMWAEAERYIYRGRVIAKTKGGSLYCAPEVIYTDNETGEPEGAELLPVDIMSMLKKNKELMDQLVDETAQKIYSTFKRYKAKVDLFYLAFSGGKDSVVALDMVQRTLPHNSFIVVFGDTQMEYVDTYENVARVEKWCKENNIDFYRAKSKLKPLQAWNIFGPPATDIRWCCSTFKTTPQILLLREITGKTDFRGMAFTGIRAEESTTRSKYDDISEGKKHAGQYSYHVIFEWGSAEVFLHIMANGIPLGDSYYKGIPRAGCLVCPNAVGRSDYFRRSAYTREVDNFLDIIKNTSIKQNSFSDARMKEFIDLGHWRTRKSGRELIFGKDRFQYTKIDEGTHRFVIQQPGFKKRWLQWIKTIGDIISLSDDRIQIKFDGKNYELSSEYSPDGYAEIILYGCYSSKADVKILSLVRSSIIKSTYCINCGVCEAECTNDCLHCGSELTIGDNCQHCYQCHEVHERCVRYYSIKNKDKEDKPVGKMDRYFSFGFRNSWLESYVNHGGDIEFWITEADGLAPNKRQDSCHQFMIDAGIITGKWKNISNKETKEKERDYSPIQNTRLGEKIVELGANNTSIWAAILVNLISNQDVPVFRWYIDNLELYQQYTDKELIDLLIPCFANDDKGHGKKNVVDSIKVIFATTPLGNERIGTDIDYAVNEKNGNITLISISRQPWYTPIPEVILYSLFKFAEACGDYYQFSLSYLMDESIERDGVSPSTIFGLDRDTMIGILNGLAINYPDFISVSISLDLETITLKKDKKAEDVLQLF